MPWSMDTYAPSSRHLSVKISYFSPKSTGQMVFTSLREVGSCWQPGMNLAFGIATDFTNVWGGQCTVVDCRSPNQTLSVLHHTPETWLTDLSLTCSLTCPAGAERTHCGVETTEHPAPPATTCIPGFCCSRKIRVEQTGRELCWMVRDWQGK